MKGHLLSRFALKPRLVYEAEFSSCQADLTIIIPFHDSEDQLTSNLPGLLNSVDVCFDLLLLSDGNDKSMNERLLKKMEPQLAATLRKLKVFWSVLPIYETKAEDYLIRQSETDWVMSVQVDHQITEDGWASRMLQVIKTNPRMIMLSGRGIHPFEEAVADLIRSRTGSVKSGGKFGRFLLSARMRMRLGGASLQQISDSCEIAREPEHVRAESFLSSGRMGKLGTLIEQRSVPNNKCVAMLAIGGTVMRGPLLINRSLYQLMGGFDSARYFLGNDDHDLAIRAWREKGLACGYTPIDVVSSIRDGTSRRKTGVVNRLVGLLLLFRSCYSPRLSGIEQAVVSGYKSPPRALQEISITPKF